METPMSLLEQIRQPSDSDAWSRLVVLYTPLLQSWLRRQEVLPNEDVDDLIQEVLLTVAEELPQFEHNQRTGAFRNWLRTILVHRLRNFWRARQHRPEVVGGSDFLKRLEQLEDENSHLSQLWDREHDHYVMNHLLQKAEPHFAPHVWQAFHRQVLQNEAPATIAEQLNVSLRSVYVAKSRVLSRLRKMVEGLVDISEDFL